MRPPARLITDDALEKALDWLVGHAAEIGRAKARAVKADHMVKHVEALCFKRSDAKSAEARKADARTSPEYLAAIVEDAEAAGEFERLKSLREAAQMRIESWRSEQANFRALRV